MPAVGKLGGVYGAQPLNRLLSGSHDSRPEGPPASPVSVLGGVRAEEGLGGLSPLEAGARWPGACGPQQPVGGAGTCE